MKTAGSVRVRLLRLALLLVLPCLAISALLTGRIFIISREDADTALLATARGLDQLVDREFAQAELLLHTLAVTEELRAFQLGEFDRLARATAMPGTAIVLVDATGRVLVDTSRPAGTPSITMPQPEWTHEVVGQTIISPVAPMFAAPAPAAGGGLAQNGAPPASQSALAVRVVLPLGGGGRHTYDLQLVMPVSLMQALLLRDPLPAGWVSSILDTAGTLVARTQEPQRFVGRPAGARLRESLAQSREGVRDGTAIDGTHVVVAYSRSDRSHWIVAVASPRAAIAAAGRQSTFLLIWFGSAAIVLGLLGAVRVARGIAKPIEAMAQAARTLGESGSWTAIPQGLAEADAVARAMFAAARVLVERRQALAGMNASLASRVEARTGELARVNTALEEQRRQLGDILDQMPVGVVVHQPDGQPYFVNQEARRLFGLPMQGRIDPASWPQMYRGTRELTRNELPWARARAGLPVPRELLMLRPETGPAIDLEVNASRVLGQDGQLTLALTTLQDVTARLEAEEVRRRSQRLEAVGQLTGGVAHEFNNLLMAISGCLELLGPHVESVFSPGSRPASLLANAARAAGRGAGLTGQLLAFARRQHLQVEPVDLNGLVIGMTQLLEGTLGRTVEVDVEVDTEPCPAMGDAPQLELVLLNLAINARDAMPGGGRLTIRTASVHTGPPVRAEDPPEGEHAVLHVSDTGHGMPPHVLARVFEPFFTTKDVGRGSGLGLPQVLGVAQQLGGGVSITSKPGQGTTVSLFLPRAPEGAVLPRSGPLVPVAPNALAGARLLVVDDDADVRETARSMLEEMGAHVLEAESGADALDLVRSSDIDLVLADLTMPQMTGVELAAAIARIRPEVPVVIMTGYGPTAMGETGPFVRATLQKPFRAEALARALGAELGIPVEAR